MKNNKGITLIALVVSIIILIILAVVSINSSIGDNGVITRSNTRKRESEIKEASDDIQSGIKRFEYYETKGSEGGVSVRLLSSESMSQFRSFINGKIAYCGSSGDKSKLVYYSKNGYFTSLVDNSGNITVKDGIILSKNERMKLDGTKSGTLFIDVDEANGYIAFGIPTEYQEYISGSNGELTVLKELPNSITITVERNGEVYGYIELNPDEPVTLAPTSITTASNSYTNPNGIVNRDIFVEEVQLGIDNVYAGYCNDKGTWKLCVYTKGSGSGIMFKNASLEQSLFKRIEFEDESIYSKVQQIDILDGVTTTTRAAFWNFFKAKTLTVGKDITLFDSLFYKTDDLYDYYADTYKTARDDAEEVSELQTLYWNCKNAKTEENHLVMYDGELYKAISAIGWGLFGKNSSKKSCLKTVYFGKDVETFPVGILQYTAINDFVWPSNINKVVDLAFNNCDNIDKSPIPLNFKGTIGNSIFLNSSIKEFSLPNAIKSVPIQTCMFCENLETVYLHDEIQRIDDKAFACCSNLKNVVFGKKLLKICEMAFSSCLSLKNVDFHPCEQSLLFVSKKAFFNCDIDYLFLPESLIQMEYGAFGLNPIKEVYYDCMDCTLNDEATGYWQGEIVFNNGTASILSSIEKITIGPNVLNIGTCMFWYCKDITSLTIPSNVKKIGIQSFMNCTSLKDITIEPGVIDIGRAVFYKTNIEELNVPNTVQKLSWASFAYMGNLKKLYWNVPNPTIEGASSDHIGYCFFNEVEEHRDNTIESIVFGPDVKVIPEGLFYFQDKLESITFSDSIETIEDQAFMYCTSLKNITIGNGVEEIGYRAFYGCYNAESITIPDSCYYVKEQAFYYCIAVSSIDLGNGLEFIGAEAFFAVGYESSIDTIVIPETIGGIGVAGFRYAKCNKIIYNIPNGYPFLARINTTGSNLVPFMNVSVNEIQITNSVNVLSTYAFAGSGVKKAVVSTTVPKENIKNSSAFMSCTNLTEVLYGGVNIINEL